MRRLVSILIGLILLSCAKEAADVPSTAFVGEDTPMQVRIGFDLPGEYGEPATRASVVGGHEYSPNLVQRLFMLCFTKEGIYLGYREAVLGVDDEMVFADGCPGRELFEGELPGRTARVHFVANFPEEHLPNNSYIGSNENTLMHSSKMAVTLDNTDITYWGFHGERSSEELRSWLSTTTYQKDGNGDYILDEKGNKIVDTSTKVEGHGVHLVRDRARVYFGFMDDVYRNAETQITRDGASKTLEPNLIDYKILQIDWIISNGLDHGYVAPFAASVGGNAEEHFDGYHSDTTPTTISMDRLTPYDRSDGGRYTASEFLSSTDQMVTVYKSTWSEAEQLAVQNNAATYLYLFEDPNYQDNPPKIILRVKYQKHRGQTDEADQITKYHTLVLLDENNEPCSLFRNHSFRLDIGGLPWQGVGYYSFDDAVAAKEYANNQTVSISDKVTDLTNGKYKLTVDQTYLIYQDPAVAGVEQTVHFTYKEVGQAGGVTEANFSVKAKDGEANDSFDKSTLSYTYNTTTGEGVVKFTPGHVTTSLRSGVIQLTDQNSGMTRFINVFTITHFSFGEPELIDTGVDRNVNEVSCRTYKMDVRIPGDFPLGLYPIKIRMASTTLNPYRVELDEEPMEGATVGVEMAPTVNGQILDGELLAGMSTVESPTSAWNYQSLSAPWNYWYTFTLVSKPTITVDNVTEEDERDHIYTFYMDDVRALRAPANRHSEIGLYLKIKYFGDAYPVTAHQ